MELPQGAVASLPFRGLPTLLRVLCAFIGIFLLGVNGKLDEVPYSWNPQVVLLFSKTIWENESIFLSPMSLAQTQSGSSLQSPTLGWLEKRPQGPT